LLVGFFGRVLATAEVAATTAATTTVAARHNAR
jgi:hypothetical protein